jgi:hypothetical protein
MHRQLCEAGPRQLVDHINRDTLDNRRENLRIANKSENAINSRKRPSVYSQYRGVSWCKKMRRWIATIRRDGTTKHLGLFLTDHDAARAYNAAALSLHGAFAVFNSIEGLTHEECLVAPVRRSLRGYVAIPPSD